MKCKGCGGVLQFQNGAYICQSCGATYSLEGIYEKIDVYICYEEYDGAGHRTKDSIVAQEVYRKLEENKVATFYERISADGLTGSDLEKSKLAAIHKTKIIIVLGASIENFSAIESKYSKYFEGRPVVPFCVDVNPSAIPKTLSKIQAMSYSTIGWDKDLIKGVYNLLGKEQDVDAGALYGRRKKKIIIASIIASVILAATAVIGWLMLKPDHTNDNANVSNPSTESVSETTEKILSQKEIYDDANELLSQGDLIGALELFLQIPDHPDSANAIKLIYAKYEGYYQNESSLIHIEVIDNVRAELILKIRMGDKVVNDEITSQIVIDNIECTCMNSSNENWKIIVQLENTGICLKVTDASGVQLTEEKFLLSEKTSRPTVQIDVETLLDWVDRGLTIDQLTELGYEISFERMTGRRGGDSIYRIEYTDIRLTVLEFTIGNASICGFSAPAEMVAPFMIGEDAMPLVKGDIVYWPNAHMTSLWFTDTGTWFNYAEEGIVLENTEIGITTRSVLSGIDYDYDGGNEWNRLVQFVENMRDEK